MSHRRRSEVPTPSSPGTSTRRGPPPTGTWWGTTTTTQPAASAEAAPVAESSRPSVVPPARVESRVETAPVAEPVTKGWFARFLDKLFGRG